MPPALVTLWPHAVRLLVGGVFIYAGYVKIIDPAGFAKNIYQYQLLPSDLLVNLTAPYPRSISSSFRVKPGQLSLF
jgi:uncharacterized membrane protein YphA (DoxX/SURF4 family)